MATSEEKTMALLSHLLCFVVGILAPLIIWVIKKDQSAYIDRHAKESLNFQLSVMIYGFISGILCLVLIGIVMLLALGVFTVVCLIIASVKAASGQEYRYPLTIRLVK